MTTEEATRKGWFTYYKCLTFSGVVVLVIGVLAALVFMTFAWLFIAVVVSAGLTMIASKLGDGGWNGKASVDEDRG